MKRWNRTVMTWECHLGLETDIEVTDMPGEHGKLVHTVKNFKITSLPGSRRALVETMILRCLISPTDQRKTIVQRFRSLEKERGEGVFLSGTERFNNLFRIVYSLPSGEHFCDWAVDYVRRFLEVFAIDDPHRYRQAGFQIAQQTFVFHEEKWVDFAWWLRESKYKLPQAYECEEAQLDSVLV